MAFIEEIKIEDINNLTNFFSAYNNEFEAVETINPDEEIILTTSQKYMNALVSSQYQRSIEAINKALPSNSRRKKRNLQQIMHESFFCGANRYGNNYIA